MSKRNLIIVSLFTAILVLVLVFPSKSQMTVQNGTDDLVAGRNVNMVSGSKLPNGDPYLQRQNEPSMAVSTRNPLHLLAGANDYRTVDLPGQLDDTETGDAWLGVFKSYDGGESWDSTLLPGYPQENSTLSPLSGFDAAADPTVRSGPYGLFFYSGIAFDRVSGGGSVVFVSRFMDNNNLEEVGSQGGSYQYKDPIQYMDTQIIDTGNSGQFEDKPWIAVDIPRAGNGNANINGQDLSVGNVYIVYSVFLGNMENDNVHNKILFAKSTDYGNTWSKPIKLSESQHVNQGTTIAINPKTGDIYVAWRRFASGSDGDAIIYVKSTDFGKKFTKAKVVHEIEYPFDQGTSAVSFRTNALPAMIVDNSSNVYLAWTQREGSALGRAEIVLSTLKGGKGGWSTVDPLEYSVGHQIMPTLTFAAGKLTAAWYDLRSSFRGILSEWIDDDPLESLDRHTIDIRTAQADPPSGSNPVFAPSIQVSRYLFGLIKNTGDAYTLEQLQYNPPNYPLFMQGNVPFLGDYIDVAPSPMFINDPAEGWRFNYKIEDPSDFHITWTDNRDVNPPSDNNWNLYSPPNSTQNPPFNSPGICNLPGMRNQNVYTSRITQGFAVGSPENFKPLWDENNIPIEGSDGLIKRAYVLVIKDISGSTTNAPKYFQLDLNIPNGYWASFKQETASPPDQDITSLQIPIYPYSSFSLSVFVQIDDPGTANPTEFVTIHINEVDTSKSYTVSLNPDDSNPGFVGSVFNTEYHSPNIANPNIANPNIANWTVANPNIANPNIANPNIANPNIANPNIANPNIANPNIANPNIANPNIANPNIANMAIPAGEYEIGEESSTVDFEWIITNDGNTASTYNFHMIVGEDLPTGVYSQLLIYRVHKTPTEEFCDLTDETHHELLINIANPNIANPNIANPNIANTPILESAFDNSTFYLRPGETAIATLRVIDPDGEFKNQGVFTQDSSATVLTNNYSNFASTFSTAIVPHATDTGETDISFQATPVKVMTTSLPDAIVGLSYEAKIAAFGGTLEYSWVIDSGPSWLDSTVKQSNGNYYLTGDVPLGYSPSIETVTIHAVSDGDSPPKTLNIRIVEPLEIDTVLEDGQVEEAYGPVNFTAKGGVAPYLDWELTSGSIPEGMDFVDGVLEGTPTIGGIYSFTVQVSDNTNPRQTAEKTFDSFNIVQNFTLSVNILPELSGTVNVSADDLVTQITENTDFSFSPGTPVTMTYEESNICYEFDKWTGSILQEEEEIQPLLITMDSDKSVTANFNRIPYTIGVSMATEDPGGREGGTISPAGDASGNVTVLCGDSVLFEINANTGFHIKNILIGGISDGPIPEGTVSSSHEFQDVQANSSIHVVFEVNWYDISVTYGTGGEIIPDGNEDGIVRVYHGQTQEFLISATETGYIIDQVFVDNISQTPIPSSFTFPNITDDHSIEATFKYVTYVISGRVKVLDSFLGGVSLPEFPGTISTNSDGYYEVTVDFGFNETVVPEKDGYAFDPPNWTFPSGGMVDVTQDFEVISRPPQWEQRFQSDLNGDNYVPVAQVADSTGVYVAGYSTDSGTGKDISIIRYNSNENNPTPGWPVTFNGQDDLDDEPSAVAVDNSGNLYVTGYSSGRTTGPDFFTAKYDSLGNRQWFSTYDGPSSLGDFATAISVQNGKVFVTGYSFRGNKQKHADIYTIAYDENGNAEWEVRYDGKRNGEDMATGITTDSTGVYVTGKSQESAYKGVKNFDYYTTKYDINNGDILWEVRYIGNANGDDVPTGIVLDSSYVYVTGHVTSDTTSTDFYTVMYDKDSGQLISQVFYGGPGRDEASGIALDESGIYVTGKSFLDGNFDFYTVKYILNGTVLELDPDWPKIYDNSGDDEATSIDLDSSGVYVTGFSSGGFFTIKYDTLGNVIWFGRFDTTANKKTPVIISVDPTTEDVYITGVSMVTAAEIVTLKYIQIY